jgi:hypothetical protein
MSYLGDKNFGSTVHFKFTTVNSTGAPTALTNGAVTVYRNGSTVPDTTGVTLSASFNGVTGMNHVQVDMSTAGFYSSAADYMAIVSSGTVGGESIAGYVVGEWSLRNRYNSSAITLDVNVAQWRGTAPSTLGTNNHIQPSSTAYILGVVNVATANSIDSVTSVSNAVNISTGSSIDSVTTVTGLVSSDVKQQVIAALSSDTYAAPTGLPGVANSLAGKIGVLYSALTQGFRISSSGKTFLSTGNAVQWVKGIGDDGSTYFETIASTST